MTDRNADLRAVLLDQLADDVPQSQTDLVADFPQRAREAGIAPARVAAANPLVLLRELESAGQAFRTKRTEDGLTRVLWLSSPPPVARRERTAAQHTRQQGLRQSVGNPLVEPPGLAALVAELSQVRAAHVRLGNQLQRMEDQLAVMRAGRQSPHGTVRAAGASVRAAANTAGGKE